MATKCSPTALTVSDNGGRTFRRRNIHGENVERNTAGTLRKTQRNR